MNYLSGLTEALPKAQIKDGTAALTEMRLIKSPQEIEFMRKACEISVKAYDRCLPQLKPGMTRREIADRLYISMIEEGAHPRHPGFLMLNSSTRYDDRRYNKGDRMVADFGACYEGYYGDITRMAIFGEPTADHKKDHETACDVIQLCFESMQPGTPHRRAFPGRQPRIVEARLSERRQPQAHRPWHRHGPSGTAIA